MDSKNVIEEPSSWIEFEEIAQQPEVVAIGPCGLDYHRDAADSETQKEMFRRQIKLACDLQKPILVHERSAQEDVMEILSRFVDIRLFFGKQKMTKSFFVVFRIRHQRLSEVLWERSKKLTCTSRMDSTSRLPGFYARFVFTFIFAIINIS